MKTILFSIILSTLLAGSAQAAVDSGTRDVLIKKFEKVYMQLPPGSKARTPITLRLADLFAERARLEAVRELEMGCVVCNAGKKDRLKSLKYYSEVLTQLPEYQRGKVMAQMGHLYEMTEQVDKAISFYKDIEKNDKTETAMRSEARFSIAEILFRRRDYAQALKYYEAALADKDFNRKGLGHYRKAWCMFNEGNVRPAISTIENMLATPALLTRGASRGVVSIDENFKDEVSRDLATFYAKDARGLSDAQKLYKASSDRVKLENVTYFAAELQRMGEAVKSIAVWNYVQQLQSDPTKRLEGWIHLSQMQLDLGNREKSLENYKKALNVWQGLGECQGEVCGELKSRIRKYVLDWNRVEKDKPSEKLFLAYMAFLEVFPEEKDMVVYTSLVARKLSKWDEAYNLTERSLKLKSDKKDLPSDESQLLSLIEIGELSKNQDLLTKAYQTYLAQSVEKSRFVDVKYQLAYMPYKEGKYEEAALRLKELAFLKVDQGTDLKVKAADLALDALALLKDDARIEKWTAEFSQLFPERRAEYNKLSRTSVFNQMAQQPDANAESAWKILGRFDLAAASEEEKIKYYRNKLILAEKLKRYADVKESAEKLLLIKGISAEDRNFALSRRSWVAELELDFKTAYETFSKIKEPKADPIKRTLKLAMFSELAGQNPDKYYQKYIKIEKDKKKSAAAAWNIYARSKQSKKVLKKYESLFMEDSARLADAYFKIYLEKSDKRAADYLLKNKKLKTSAPAKVIWRQRFLADFDKYDQKISKHEFKSKTQRQLSRSLRGRDKLLKQGGQKLKKAAQYGDWTAQVVCLNVLAREANRFYQEILSLPIPEGLTPEEQNQYLQLLSQQASPHEIKAKELQAKFDEFWGQMDLFASLSKQFSEKTGKERAFFTAELERLQKMAPEDKKPQLASILALPEKEIKTPSLIELQQAKTDVRQDPRNIAKLEKLRAIEKEMKNAAMVGYIDSRIDVLRSQQ